ncbi:uncharacterized protein AMSG_03862 [Thecamonas trahens ATCC 50062]|uniref:Tyrosine-protein kinase ephrin type A/B receptor-like domain-containing protein n=1 Tax=Thecamonas trahens ATCC 50062 TaxID=461836 RepID=A0A0L0D519_THETB|nr:hypothetical protein AMSG_03862 [Thecamonas trahens ATCC 50062]KNC47429.1 hypothetical protein AMSG_03862 [Thecamonas trahens ATCC 50062]|eukprot:XP_013759765.1 hypothetical protein AMSG_03862 [Thecamonas trahens ATCC 50062]
MPLLGELYIGGPGLSFTRSMLMSSPCLLPVSADFNGDGVLDVVISSPGVISVFLAPGSVGSWDPPLGSTSGHIAGAATASESILTVDMDLDGDLDLIVADPTDALVIWYANDAGDGTTWSPNVIVPPILGVAPLGMAWADLNNDGFPDVVASLALSQVVAIVLSPGSTSYTAADVRMFPTAYAARGLALIDLDADGDLDLVVAPGSIKTELAIAYHENTGNGVFSSVILTSPANGRQVGMVLPFDADGNGVDDVISCEVDAFPVLYSKISLVEGTPVTGPFLREAFYTARRAENVAAGDANSDGFTDLIFAAFGVSGEPTIRVVELLPVAPFSQLPVEVALDNAVSRVSMWALGDLDGDGDVDVVVGDAVAGVITWAVADASGGLAAAAAPLATFVPGTIVSVAVADMTGDAALDIVACLADGNVTFVVSEGRGQFGAAARAASDVLGSGAVPNAMILANLNGDDMVDVLAWNAARIGVALNDGSGNLLTPQLLPAATGTIAHVCVADVDSDGDDDVVFADAAGGTIYAAAQTSPGVFAATASALVTGEAGVAFVALAHINGDDALDLVWHAAGASFSWSANVAGAFPGPVSSHATPSPVVSLALHDETGERRSHVVVSLATAAYWWINAPRTGLGASIHVVAQGLTSVHSGRAHDVNGDGVSDVMFVDDNTLYHVSVARLEVGAGRNAANVLSFDHAECGGVVSSVACLSAALARTSGCVGVTRRWLQVPARVTAPFTRCHTTHGPLRVRGSFNMRLAPGHPGGMAIDCGQSGGQLFVISAGVRAVVAGIDIRGMRSSTLPDIKEGSTGIRVEGLGAHLELHNLEVRGCSSADALTFHAHSGIGGAVAVVDGGSFVASGVVFRDNTAGAAGGAVGAQGGSVKLTFTDVLFASNVVADTVGVQEGGGAVSILDGSSMVVAMTNVTFSGNSVATGSGGCLEVAALTTRVVMHNVEFDGCSASNGGGGAVSIVGPSTLVVTLSGTLSRIVNSTAAYGGGVAVATKDVLPQTLGGSGIATEVGTLGASFTMSDGTFGDRLSAMYGGAAFVCNGVLDLQQAILTGASRAENAGGFCFFCSIYESRWLVVGSEAGHTATVTRGFNARLATPPTAAHWITALPSSAMSGLAFGSGAVAFTDSFGNPVLDPLTKASLSVTNGGSFVVNELLAGSAFSAALGGMSLADGAVAARSAADLGTDAMLRVGVFLGTNPSVYVDGRVRIGACEAGYGATATFPDPLVCSICLGLTFSNETSAAACQPEVTCGGDAVAINGVCQVCPAGTDRLYDEARVPGACECRDGYWTPLQRQDVACAACPDGASCPGGVELPVAREGWFPTGAVTDGAFHKCVIKEACLAGGVCSGGYLDGSYMCKDCAEGYFRNSLGGCSSCPTGSSNLVFVLFGSVVAGAVAAVLLAWWTYRQFVASESTMASTLEGDGAGEATTFGKRTKVVPHSLSVLLIYLQIINIVGSAPFNWPPLLEKTMLYSRVANVDMSLFATGCSISSFYSRYVMGVLLPLLFFVVTVVLVVMFRICGCLATPVTMEPISTWAVVGRLVFTVGPLFYIPLCSSTLIFFDCTLLPNGGWYLDADLETACFDAEWWQYMPVAAGAVVAYVVAMPTLFAVTLVRHRAELDDPRTILKLGPIYNLYRRHYYYYELVLLGKRLAIVSAALFFSNLEVWLFLALASIFLSSLMFQIRHDPFYQPLHNRVESFLNATVTTLIFLGMMFWADDFPNHESYSVVLVISMVMLVASVVFVATMAVQEVINTHHVSAAVRDRDSAVLGTQDAVFVDLVKRYAPDLENVQLAAAVSEAVDSRSLTRGGSSSIYGGWGPPTTSPTTAPGERGAMPTSEPGAAVAARSGGGLKRRSQAASTTRSNNASHRGRASQTWTGTSRFGAFSSSSPVSSSDDEYDDDDASGSRSGGIALRQVLAAEATEAGAALAKAVADGKEWNHHTIGCGKVRTGLFDAVVCFEKRYAELSRDVASPIELAFTVVERVFAKSEDVPHVEKDQPGSKPYTCGDSWAMRWEHAGTGASFAPVSITADAKNCDRYVVKMYLPPLAGSYGLDMRLLHVDGSGMADPRPDEMERLAFPNPEALPEAGPFGFNVKLETIDDDSPLGLLHVMAWEGWEARSRDDPVCTGARGFRENERFGWWLPPIDGETPDFPRLGLQYYHVNGCPVGRTASTEFSKCMADTALDVLGESIGGHVANLALQHVVSLEVDKLERGEQRGVGIGRYHQHPSMMTRADPLFAGRNPPPGEAGGCRRFSGHGLMVTEPMVLRGQVPRDEAEFLAVIMGANDAMRETLEIWEQRWTTLLDKLEERGWGGTLVLFTTPVRRYKATAEGDASIRAGKKDKYDVEIFGGRLLGADAEMQHEERPLGRVAAESAVGSGFRVRDRARHTSSSPRSSTPRFYNTYPRVKAFSQRAIDIVSSRLPESRRALVDFEAITDGLHPDYCRDGVHYCAFSESLWPYLANNQHWPHCGPTHAAADLLFTRVCGLRSK